MVESYKNYDFENKELFKTIIEYIYNLEDIKSAKINIINLIGKELDTERCYIMEYDAKKDIFKKIDIEYLASSLQDSYKETDFNLIIPELMKEMKQGKFLFFTNDKLFIDNNEIDLNNNSYFADEKRSIECYNIKAGIMLPIYHGKTFLGTFVIHYRENIHDLSEAELDLLKFVCKQLSIAIYQAKLFDELRVQNKTMTAILNNIPFMAWIKDSNSRFIMVNKKMTEAYGITEGDFIGKDDSFFTPELTEAYKKYDKEVMDTKKTKVIEEFIMLNGEKFWSETFKSPIIDADGNVLGTVGLAHEITDRKEAEIKLLDNQKKILQYVEQEKITRGIIEILRSSLEAPIIKKQFVKNIGKFFNANRVFFSDYDKQGNNYMPVEDSAEYLSSNNEESFVGYSWTNSCISAQINQLLEKREIKIPNWNEFINAEPKYNCEKFHGIKSSYKFPVVYQTEMLGFFCIDFTQSEVKLTEDDIIKIRSFCTQTGIALYQSELYTKAQDIIKLKLKLINYIDEKTKNIFEDINKILDTIPENVTSCPKHIQLISDIKANASSILTLINEIEKS